MRPDSNDETLEAALLEELIDHVDFLRSTEPTFGHATALAKYGRKFLPRPHRPDWLLLGQKRACFVNAASYAMVRDDVLYAEGYAMEPDIPIPIQHAWLVDRNGAVIDPTWDDTSEHVYLGIAFKRSFVSELLASNKNEPGILVNMHLLRQRLRTPDAVEDAIVRGRAELGQNGS
jgi:hypothetical protein